MTQMKFKGYNVAKTDAGYIVSEPFRNIRNERCYRDSAPFATMADLRGYVHANCMAWG